MDFAAAKQLGQYFLHWLHFALSAALCAMALTLLALSRIDAYRNEKNLMVYSSNICLVILQYTFLSQPVNMLGTLYSACLHLDVDFSLTCTGNGQYSYKHYNLVVI